MPIKNYYNHESTRKRGGYGTILTIIIFYEVYVGVHYIIKKQFFFLLIHCEE